jgi:hypothetical protein
MISISAIAEADDPLGREPGELLCDEPEGYNYGAFLKARQRETSPMMWSALYQQRPAPEKGDYFKADWPQVFGDASIFRLVPLLICRLRSLPTERPRLQLVNRSQIRGPLHPLQCGVKIGRRLTARPIPLAIASIRTPGEDGRLLLISGNPAHDNFPRYGSAAWTPPAEAGHPMRPSDRCSRHAAD